MHRSFYASVVLTNWAFSNPSAEFWLPFRASTTHSGAEISNIPNRFRCLPNLRFLPNLLHFSVRVVLFHSTLNSSLKNPFFRGELLFTSQKRFT